MEHALHWDGSLAMYRNEGQREEKSGSGKQTIEENCVLIPTEKEWPGDGLVTQQFRNSDRVVNPFDDFALNLVKEN